jgi:hypothetical protein
MQDIEVLRRGNAGLAVEIFRLLEPTGAMVRDGVP